MTKNKQQQQQETSMLLRNIAYKLNDLGTAMLRSGQGDDALVMYQEACSAINATFHLQQNKDRKSQEVAIQRGIDSVLFGEETLSQAVLIQGKQNEKDSRGNECACSTSGRSANTSMLTQPIPFIALSNSSFTTNELMIDLCNLSTAFYNMALTCSYQNAYYMAERLFKLSVEIAPAGGFCDTPVVYCAKNNLGHIAYMLKNYDDATVDFSEAIQQVRKVLSSFHERFLSKDEEDMIRRDYLVVLTNHTLTMLHFGEAFENHDLLDEAMTVYKGVVDSWMQDFPQKVHQCKSEENDITVAFVLSLLFDRIGNIHHRKGELAQAIRAFERARNLRTGAIGDGHMDVESLMHVIGVLNLEAGRANEAIKSFNDCLARRQVVYGHNSKEVAEVFYEIGKIHQDLHQHEQALSLYSHALQVEKEILGSTHPDVAVTLNNIGQCFHSLKQFDRALEAYKEVLAMISLTLGSDHSFISEIYNSIGIIYADMGNDIEAARAFSEARRVDRSVTYDQGQEQRKSLMLLEEITMGHCAPAA